MGQLAGFLQCGKRQKVQGTCGESLSRRSFSGDGKALQYSDSSLSVTPFHGAQNYFPSSSRGVRLRQAYAETG
ncbi:MAG: hypothetical protein IJB33_03185, partial [Akkermansia sp.]|nr:hypothetical protein [Akkermansia sp.]